MSSSWTARNGSKKVAGTRWSWCLRLGQRFGNAPKCYGISLRCTERDNVQPKCETYIPQSQFVRSRVPRSQCLRRRTVGTRRTLQGTWLRRFRSSRDGFRLGKMQGTRRTQTHWFTMLGNTTVDTRETSISESSGHEEQNCRSLHETSGWIANIVAREETWTSNPGWYERYKWGRLRNDDNWKLLNSASSRARV